MENPGVFLGAMLSDEKTAKQGFDTLSPMMEVVRAKMTLAGIKNQSGYPILLS